jgi:hypothetical protein
MTQLLDEAAEALERRLFFDRMDTRYAELRSDAAAWTEIGSERVSEDGALGDGSR